MKITAIDIEALKRAHNESAEQIRQMQIAHCKEMIANFQRHLAELEAQGKAT